MPIRYINRDDDFSELVFADGTRADALRVRPLWERLRDMKVDGIAASMGKHHLLQKYRERCEREAAA